MERRQIDFLIQEAGCLLYAADAQLGGKPFRELHHFGWQDLTLKGALMGTALYQDDGYNVRVVFGDLTEEEKSEWTGSVAWKLNLESGRMVVSGVCDEDLEDYMEDFPTAQSGGDYQLGCFVEVPKGEYAAAIYSYPPNDLSGGWMRIAEPGSFKLCFGAEAGLKYEKPLDYFARTRTGETPPDWIRNGWENDNFLDFVIHLAPLSGELTPPGFEDDGCLLWTYRKPDICPKGIRL
ncbi:MAG TPA: hypothetical protein VNB22_17145 [Pyrinomonadaceae bacterium]|nr:hypothetical protein [Pyrinomonadaceae bacterium]